MAKEQFGSNAQFTGSGLGISTIGKHLYGYSGARTIASGGSADTTMLDFATGKYYVGLFWTGIVKQPVRR